MTDRYMTLEEVAAWLRVSVRTVQRLTASGALRAIRIGAARLYMGSDIEHYAGCLNVDLRAPLLTPDEAMRRLNLRAPEQLRALVDRGEIESIRIGRQLRFHRNLTCPTGLRGGE